LSTACVHYIIFTAINVFYTSFNIELDKGQTTLCLIYPYLV